MCRRKREDDRMRGSSDSRRARAVACNLQQVQLDYNKTLLVIQLRRQHRVPDSSGLHTSTSPWWRASSPFPYSACCQAAASVRYEKGAKVEEVASLKMNRHVRSWRIALRVGHGPDTLHITTRHYNKTSYNIKRVVACRRREKR